MAKRKNILFLVHNFNMGGVQKANVQMINKLNKNKFYVHVMYINDGILKDELTENVKVTKLGSIFNRNLVINLRYLRIIMKYINQNKIDLIHTIDPILYYIGSVAAKIRNIKHVRTQPNFIRRHEPKNAKTIKITPFEKSTDIFVTYNHASAKDLELAGVDKSKIKVIHGFHSNEEYLYYAPVSNIKTMFNIPEKNKIILAMHRMVPKKGYGTFISMIPYIVNEYPDVTFLLVGDGPLKEEFKKKVANLGVSKYVKFVGFQKNIANIIKQIDFAVYPLADTAAMGTVIRGGKILITKKNSSMDEYIKNGENGYLVSKETPKEYAKYSLKLLKNPKLVKEMEEKQKQFTLKMLDGKNNIKKLEKVFLSIIDSGEIK